MVQAETRLAAKTWPEGDLVFTTADGWPLHSSTVTKSYQRMLAANGLPRQRFHDLRHTSASFLLANGEPLKVVSERLGHSGIGITATGIPHPLSAR